MVRLLYAFRMKNCRGVLHRSYEYIMPLRSFTYRDRGGRLVTGIHSVSVENKCPIRGNYTSLGVVYEYVSIQNPDVYVDYNAKDRDAELTKCHRRASIARNMRSQQQLRRRRSHCWRKKRVKVRDRYQYLL